VVDDEHDGEEELSNEASSDADGRGNDQGGDARSASPSSKGAAMKTRRRRMRQTHRQRYEVHRKWSHANCKRLRRTAASGHVHGLVFDGEFEMCDCDTCMRRNATKSAFRKMTGRRSRRRGWRIHSDLKEWSVRSKHGYKYSICFVDDCSRRGKAYPMRKKDEALAMLKRFIAEECTTRGFTVAVLRSDNGGEYIGGEFCAYCQTHKIRREYSPPMCQSGNGVSECYWREVARSVRAVLWDQQRDDDMWPAALEAANTTRNHLHSEVVDGSGVPEVEWSGEDVDVSHWQVPLCTTWSYIEKEKRAGGSLNDQRLKGVLVGYATDSPCYQVYDEQAKRVFNRRYEDVKCDNRECVPKDGRVHKGSLHAIEEETEQEMLEEGADNDEAQPQNAGQAVEEANPTACKKHNGEEFIKTSKQQSVETLAGTLNCDPSDYLALLKQYEGWYQDLKSVRSVVKAGADVPVPQLAPALARALRAPKAKAARTREQRSVNRPRKADTEEEAAVTAGSSRVTRRRRSLRVQAAEKDAALDCQAMLSLAVEFSKQAAAETKPAIKWKPGTVLGAESTVALYCNDEPRDAVYYEALAAGEIPITTTTRTPKSQREAHSGVMSMKWIASEKKEWDGLWGKGAFEDVELSAVPHDHRLLHLLWLYKVKSDGTFKTRLCADGRRQPENTYGDVASPTMRTTSFRVLLALAAMKKWKVWADDAQQAFLQSKRPEEQPLYAAYPTGFKKPGHALKILRYLYGLKDSPMGFFLTVKKHLIEDQSFVQSKNDDCLFVKYRAGSESDRARITALEKAGGDHEAVYPAPVELGDVSVAVVLHVDDFASTGEDGAVAEYRQQLHKRFIMTGGLIKEYYGLDVQVRDGEITLGGTGYIGRMLTKLGVLQVPPGVVTPMAEELVLERLEGECQNKALHSRYRTVVGMVLHLAVCVRPDVGASARALSSHLQHPTTKHLAAAMRVVYYLANTRTLSLTYGRFPEEASFYGTCDASFNSEEGSKGITGWAFHLAGGAICWKSKTQGLVALSSTESELIAVDDAARELRYLEKLLADFGVPPPRPTPMGQDNTSTCILVGSKRWNPRTKHMALRYHSTGDMQRAGVLQVKYLPTQHMPSDVLTKPLSVELHRRHTVVLLGIARLRWEERVEQVRQQKDTAAEDKKRAVVSVGAYKHKPKRQKSR
jgi:hypothetical protein